MIRTASGHVRSREPSRAGRRRRPPLGAARLQTGLPPRARFSPASASMHRASKLPGSDRGGLQVQSMLPRFLYPTRAPKAAPALRKQRALGLEKVAGAALRRGIRAWPARMGLLARCAASLCRVPFVAPA